jgi:predicted dienelactone hydrolase
MAGAMIIAIPKRLFAILLACTSTGVLAHDNRIDVVLPGAPELARFGEYDIGVRTLVFTDPNRPDVLNTLEGGDTVFYDRSLTVEVWYPASLAENQQPGGDYTSSTRNPDIIATLHGKAVRDATVLSDVAPMPLVIVSHGYPGNRYLMSHLSENLASKGYVVAAIDHRDSTYTDQQAVASSLYNRPLDQLFVLEQMAVLSGDSASFLSDLVDAERTGVVGYSMGGYGLVVNLGGGYSDQLVANDAAPPNALAMRHAASNVDYRINLDPRIKAGFAVAPWGMAAGVWNADDLEDIQVPTFYLAGSVDTTAGYEDGTRAIFENATRSDRYLLTYINAGHNAGAPIPLPVEISNNTDDSGASHYTDPAWNTVRMNNIMDHFATAFFDYILKDDPEGLKYLRGTPTYWKGFAEGAARGLILEHLGPAE